MKLNLGSWTENNTLSFPVAEGKCLPVLDVSFGDWPPNMSARKSDSESPLQQTPDRGTKWWVTFPSLQPERWLLALLPKAVMLVDTGCFANTCSLVHSYHIPPGLWECCKNMPVWAHPSALLATIRSNGFWFTVTMHLLLSQVPSEHETNGKQFRF